MENNYTEEAEALNKEIKMLLDSGMTVQEFIRRRLLHKYAETGDDRIKDIAADYFISKLEDDGTSHNK